MKTAFVAILLIAAVSANPFAWAAPQAGAVASASAAPKRKGNRTHHHHKEPTPTFRQTCQCQMPVIPANMLSANEKCLMEHAAAMGCYLGSKGGCASPAPACGLGPLKGVPLV
ncbi:hypothetical protein J1614_006741 [Plenodomus biglobosus]|nr:hypothetical protein J1614_006741 [Plenodomus biglobosus]